MKFTYCIQENGKVTIPAEIRKRYQIKEGDVLELVEIENGLLLKPTTKTLFQVLNENAEDQRK